MNKPNKGILTVLAAIWAAGMVTGCGTPEKIGYLRDLQPGELLLQETQQLTLGPGDRLRINVYSRDQELANLFNLYSPNGTGENHPYTIDKEGYIEMPILGRIHVQGLTRLELADQVKYRLLASQMLNDPTVLVDYADMCFYALGELGRRGRIEIPRDEVTILEAISLAGDLTITGRRDNVLVLRSEKGVQQSYRIDLTNVQSVYSSPAYYLQQNDIVYVEPNESRASQSDSNARLLRTPTFWFSTISFATSMVALIMRWF